MAYAPTERPELSNVDLRPTRPERVRDALSALEADEIDALRRNRKGTS